MHHLFPFWMDPWRGGGGGGSTKFTLRHAACTNFLAGEIVRWKRGKYRRLSLPLQSVAHRMRAPIVHLLYPQCFSDPIHISCVRLCVLHFDGKQTMGLCAHTHAYSYSPPPPGTQITMILITSHCPSPPKKRGRETPEGPRNKPQRKAGYESPAEGRGQRSNTKDIPFSEPHFVVGRRCCCRRQDTRREDRGGRGREGGRPE